MTGLYPHQAGIGDMNYDLGVEAYQGEPNHQCVTLAEVLKGAGYATYMTGKWHLTTFQHNNAQTDAGKANWPSQRGFDHYYGVIAGQANYFHSETLTLENERLAPPPNNFYTTDAFSDYKAPSLIEVQPVVGLSMRRDTKAAVGNYTAPNPLDGKVENVKVVAK